LTVKTTDALRQAVLVRRVILGTLSASLLVGFVVMIVLVQGYRQRQEQAAVTVDNLSWVMEQTLYGAIGLIDHALLTATDEAERELIGGGIDPGTFNAFLVKQNSRLGKADGLRATNAQGVTLYGEGVIPGANAVGRDYFNTLTRNPNAGLAISKPLIGRISGKWAVIFARRFNDSDGNFGGVVFSPVNLDSFAKMLSMVKVGRHGVISLIDVDASLIARYPEQGGFGTTIGKSIESERVRELIRTGTETGVTMGRSTVDGIERLFSSRKITGYPLYVAVGLSPADYMADWWTNAVFLIGLWVLFSVVMLFLMIQKARGWRQRVTTLRTLEENADLEVKVAERTRELEDSNRKLEALSAKDGLTGIANRRRFEEALAGEWSRAARGGQPLALALFDVDLFKNYNDHYGHLQGDDCLRKVASLIDGHARRPGDLVARYGGEEFAFLAPAQDADAALTLVEMIRGALEAKALPHAMSPLECVTISVGVAAVVPTVGGAPETLVKMADDALYRAKRQGRNRAVLADVAITD